MIIKWNFKIWLGLAIFFTRPERDLAKISDSAHFGWTIWHQDQLVKQNELTARLGTCLLTMVGPNFNNNRRLWVSFDFILLGLQRWRHETAKICQFLTRNSSLTALHIFRFALQHRKSFPMVSWARFLTTMLIWMGYGTVISHYVPILAVFVYFGRFPTCFGPFQKPQSPSTLQILESASDPEIESYT